MKTTPSADALLAAEFGKFIPALNGFARSLYRNDESAADLAQETLARAWQARGSFVPGTNLRAWLFTIMHNQFRSEARRAWRQVPWNEGAAETITAPPMQQLWTVELDDTTRAVNALPARLRDAVILTGIGGFSIDEAAAMLHCRRTAMKSRVHRARRAVQEMLDGTRQIRTRRSRRTSGSITDIVRQMEELSSTAMERGRAAAT